MLRNEKSDTCLLALIPANNLVASFGFSIFIGYRQLTTYLFYSGFWEPFETNVLNQAWEPTVCIQTKISVGCENVCPAFRFKMAITQSLRSFICGHNQFDGPWNLGVAGCQMPSLSSLQSPNHHKSRMYGGTNSHRYPSNSLQMSNQSNVRRF